MRVARSVLRGPRRSNAPGLPGGSLDEVLAAISTLAFCAPNEVRTTWVSSGAASLAGKLTIQGDMELPKGARRAPALSPDAI
ncbi:MAG: hypothetical protein ACRDJF_13345 [Actinomycetota bacterium]